MGKTILQEAYFFVSRMSEMERTVEEALRANSSADACGEVEGHAPLVGGFQGLLANKYA